MSMLTRMLRRAGRLLEPLLAPDAEEQRQRSDRMASLVKDQATAIRALGEQVTAERAELQRMRDVRSADVEETRDRIADLKSGVRRQGSALARLARTTGIHTNLEWTEQRILDRLSRIARSGKPVIVGPWTGEIGFELLYWIPFVRWATDKFGIDPGRVTVVSRGGTRAWYAGLAERYVDAFALVSPDEFRAATEQVKKQRAMRLFDRRLLRRVALQGGDRPTLLHPALMYALFMPFWKHQAALTRVADHARYRRIVPAAAALPPLPADYVAVRFYFSGCFPDTPSNRAFVGATIASLAEHRDVVMLNPGFRVDDHVDYAGAAHHRIHYVDMAGSPEDNLATQTAIIAGAKAFIGTYGGFAYLAPFCGVDAVAFYSERTYFVYHLELALRAFGEAGGGSLEAIDVRNAGTLRSLLGVSHAPVSQ